MRVRPGRVVLGAASGLALLVGALVDVPKLSDGAFWSDAASYHAMAGSLAFDHDLEFRPEDLARIRASHPAGPEGVFLKRVADRAGGTRLVYAKPFLYPTAAAPLVRLLGVDRGLLLLNALVFVAALWLGYGILREAFADGLAAAGVLAVFLGGITPVYLLWETPEIFYLGLVTLGLFLWRRGRWLAAAVVLGAAAYGKPTNAALALPLMLEPLLAGATGAAPGWRSRLLAASGRAAAVAAVVACGYGLNWAATGELNYQGGERKTFYDRYPGEAATTFDNAGVWMTTNHLGPLITGRDEESRSDRVAPPRTSAELRQSFALNLLLFWIGRFSGVLPYFPGVALAALLFLLVGPRGRAGWLALVALVASWIGYLLMIPDNWYGGGGTLGNRYFLNLVPLGLLLLPRGRTAWAALAALPLAAALLGPMSLAPVYHSLRPGEHATAAAFRVLPAELTMLGDLSVFTDVWRRHRPYNLPGGDPARRAPGDPPPYYLWFLDDGTYGQESSFGEEGFWLRGGQQAEVVVQALAPATRLRLLVRAGPAGDIVTVRLGRDRQRAVLRPLEAQALVFEPRDAPVGYYGTQLYPLRLGSRFGAATASDRRRLGSFVTLQLD
ncbi:MAG TPA: hypothetical protein VMX54_04345 [Vicinamibacteria bacterium]|nr:hypothetical protein [Vicinamibacteria bacterium]